MGLLVVRGGTSTKVFALGGAGQYGRETAQKLVASQSVSEIVVAGRDIARAKRVAAELGDKATAVQADAMDEKQVTSQAADSDIIVNTAGPSFEASLPGLRAALKARVNYVDLNTDGPTTEQALALDTVAKKAGVTAIVGIGIFPGLSSLMMTHAARQLDQVEELKYCFPFPFLFGGDPRTVLEGWRKSGHADASWRDIMRQVASKVRVYRGEHWVDVEPPETAVPITLPQGKEVNAVPVGNADTVTLPRTLRGVKSVLALACFLPTQINEKYCELGHRIASGEINESTAAFHLYEYVAAQPEGWLGNPKDYESGFETVVEAVGTKRNQRARYRCWPSGPWGSTSGPLATATLKILRGEVRTPGVLAPASCLDPLPFFAEVAQYVPEKPSGEGLLEESFEVLG